VVFGKSAFLRSRAARLGLSIAIETATPSTAATIFPRALPVVELDGLVPDSPGEPTPVSAPVVLAAISEAVSATLSGQCRSLVTAPINKAVLYGAGFRYPGHTEYLAALCARNGAPKLPVMMLAHDDLRVAPLTIHVPLAEVPALITTELIGNTVRTLEHDLRTRFGIAAPKIAVAGLNPHAGENGGIGRDELDLIAPAIAELRFSGINVEGPFPADTLFYPPRWRQFDVVVAMYHDQAMIPIKTVAFDAAVNITLGLPIVRTSPYHGTAFDLAGTGKASSGSFGAALGLADMLTARQ
jgi:4-hydroxythreonine-4-phosphate dehydrogenase